MAPEEMTQKPAQLDLDTFIRRRKAAGKSHPGNFVPWQEGVSHRIPIPYFILWIIVGEILFLTLYLLDLFYGKPTDVILFAAFLCLMIGYWNGLVIHISRELDQFFDSLKHFVDIPEDELRSWYILRVRRLLGWRGFLFFFLVLGVPLIIALPGYTRFFQQPQIWFSSLSQRTSFMLIWVIFCCLAARHCAISAGLVSLIRDISYLPLHLGLDLESSKSVRTIAALFFKLSLHYVVLTCFAFGMVIFSPFSLSALSYSCLFAAGLFLLFVFLGPQWFIHLVMVHEKRERIRAFNGHFEKIIASIESSPTDEHFARFDAYMRFREKLTKMPEWPFDVGMLFGVISAIVIPMIILILQLIFG